MSDVVYAPFRERIRSAFVDATIWSVWFLAMMFVPWPADMPGQMKLAIWLLPPLFGEPVIVSRQRASIGQRMRGLVVAARPGHEFPSFPSLCARHFLKIFLGGTSLLYIPFSPRAETLHDSMFKTVVLMNGTEAPPRTDPQTSSGSGPMRRFLFTAVWAAITVPLASLCTGIILAIVYPEIFDDTQPAKTALELISGAVVVVVALRTFYLGANGRLPGTRSEPGHDRAELEKHRP